MSASRPREQACLPKPRRRQDRRRAGTDAPLATDCWPPQPEGNAAWLWTACPQGHVSSCSSVSPVPWRFPIRCLPGKAAEDAARKRTPQSVVLFSRSPRRCREVVFPELPVYPVTHEVFRIAFVLGGGGDGRVRGVAAEHEFETIEHPFDDVVRTLITTQCEEYWCRRIAFRRRSVRRSVPSRDPRGR